MDSTTAVEYLKNSMIYQMSLGSKELFHSNVWWWLIEHDKNFIKVFIPDFEPMNYHNGEDFCIWPKREDLKRDILIWLEDNDGNRSHIVIENKIKALPTVQQLERYTVNFKTSSFFHGVLTGIGPCTLELSELKNVNNVSGEWSYVSYDEISNRILKYAMSSKEKIISTHLEQIEEYCNIINCINIILDENAKMNENVLTYKYDESLNDLRIADIFKKRKGSQFINYVKSRKPELEKLRPEDEKYKLVIAQSFNNGKTTLDVSFSNWVNTNTVYQLLGVEIEGDQFRIVAERNGRLEKISADDIYDNYKDDWFDDSYDKKDNKSVFGYPTTMKPREGKKYDVYITNDYYFLYQYFNVSKEDGNYELLFEMIKKYLSKASSIINKRRVELR